MRYPSWFYAVRGTTSQQRYMMVIFTHLVIFTLWWLLIYPMTVDMLITAQQRVAGIHTEQQAATTAHDDIQTLTRDVQEVQQLLQQYAQQKPLRERIDSVLKDLESAGLTLMRLTNHDAHMHGWYQLQQVDLQAQGSLEQIIQFLTRIKEHVDLVDVAEVLVQQMEHALYQLQIQIHVYTLETESPSTLKKAEGLGG